MKKISKLLVGLFTLTLLLFAGKTQSYAAATTYTVTISAGVQGSIKNLSAITVESAEWSAKQNVFVNAEKDKVTLKNLPYKAVVSIDYQSLISIPEGSLYYVKGVRLSGRDNNTVAESAFSVISDQDYVVAYGIPGELVNYTVNFLNTSGEKIADSVTYYGNVGDTPVIACLYFDGYIPTTRTLSQVLDADAAKNVFNFYYVGSAVTTLEGTHTTYVEETMFVPGEPYQGETGEGEVNVVEIFVGPEDTGEAAAGANVPDAGVPGAGAGAGAGENAEVQEPPVNENMEPVEIEDEQTPQAANPFQTIEDALTPLANQVEDMSENGMLLPVMLGIFAAAAMLALAVVLLVSRRKKAPADRGATGQK